MGGNSWEALYPLWSAMIILPDWVAWALWKGPLSRRLEGSSRRSWTSWLVSLCGFMVEASHLLIFLAERTSLLSSGCHCCLLKQIASQINTIHFSWVTWRSTSRSETPLSQGILFWAWSQRPPTSPETAPLLNQEVSPPLLQGPSYAPNLPHTRLGLHFSLRFPLPISHCPDNWGVL